MRHSNLMPVFIAITICVLAVLPNSSHATRRANSIPTNGNYQYQLRQRYIRAQMRSNQEAWRKHQLTTRIAELANESVSVNYRRVLRDVVGVHESLGYDSSRSRRKVANNVSPVDLSCASILEYENQIQNNIPKDSFQRTETHNDTGLETLVELSTALVTWQVAQAGLSEVLIDLPTSLQMRAVPALVSTVSYFTTLFIRGRSERRGVDHALVSIGARKVRGRLGVKLFSSVYPHGRGDVYRLNDYFYVFVHRQ